MVVVLIIGILVTIATPVFLHASAVAEGKSCQANQRTLTEAASLMVTSEMDAHLASAGVFKPGGSGWYGLLVPDWVRKQPTCPTGGDAYYMTAAGDITGDNGADPGAVPTFKSGHHAP